MRAVAMRLTHDDAQHGHIDGVIGVRGVGRSPIGQADQFSTRLPYSFRASATAA